MKSHIKGITLLFTTTLLSFNVMAGNPAKASYGQSSYHPETPGITLTYACLDKKGEIEGYYTMKLLNVEKMEGQEIFHYFQQFYRPDGDPILKETGLPLKVTVSSEEPTLSQLKGWTRAIKTMDMVAKGDVNTLPDTLHVATTLPESEIKIKLDQIGASLYTTEREVKEHKTISIAAGDFDAYYMTETQEMHAVITIEEKLETWYARGIGAVKQRILNKKGQFTRGMELIDVRLTDEDELTDILPVKEKAEKFLVENIEE